MDITKENFWCEFRLFLTGIAVVMGGSFHFGYQVSLINPAAEVLQNFLVESFNKTHDINFSEATLRIIWPTVAGQLFTGALIGSLISPKIIDFMGLKRSILFSSVILSTSFFLSILSKWLSSPELFIFGRFLSGSGIGMSTTMQTIYLTEISPITHRGTMGTLTGFANSIGFVIASGIGLPQLFGQSHLWEFIYVIEVIPTIILIFVMGMFLYESPVILLKNGKEKEAINCLELYYPKSTTTKRLDELVKETKILNDTDCVTIKQLIQTRAPRNALILCLLLNATVSFSGILAVSFFGTFLLQRIGFSEAGAAAANCFASFFGILGNIVGSYTIDKIGRRKILIGGLVSLAILNILLMVLLIYFKSTFDVRTGYAFLFIFMMFLFIFSLGVGPMAWFIGSELTDANYRPWIQSLSTSCQYLTCFISPLIFFPFYQSIGSLSFLIFVVPLTTCSIYLYFYLPETKNCAIEQIIRQLDK